MSWGPIVQGREGGDQACREKNRILTIQWEGLRRGPTATTFSIWGEEEKSTFLKKILQNWADGKPGSRIHVPERKRDAPVGTTISSCEKKTRHQGPELEEGKKVSLEGVSIQKKNAPPGEWGKGEKRSFVPGGKRKRESTLISETFAGGRRIPGRK